MILKKNFGNLAATLSQTMKLANYTFLHPSTITNSEIILWIWQFSSLSGKDTDGRGQVIRIADWAENSEDSTKQRHFLVTTAGLHISVFNIGYPHERGTFNSYILQLPNGDFSIYKPRQWNHLCYAWSSGGRSKIMLVYEFQIVLEQTLKLILNLYK